MVKNKKNKEILGFYTEMAKEQLDHEPMNHEELFDFLVDANCEEWMAEQIATDFEFILKE
jgi:hypothetical protein